MTFLSTYSRHRSRENNIIHKGPSVLRKKSCRFPSPSHRTTKTSISKKSKNQNMKVKISALTLNSIKNELSAYSPLPDSIHNIALALSESDSIMLSHHSSSSSSSSQQSTFLNDQLRDLNISSSSSSKIKINNDLRFAFKKMATDMGSLDVKVNGWDQLSSFLKKWLLFPEEEETNNNINKKTPNNKNITSWARYLQKLNQLIPQGGWRQIPSPPSVSTTTTALQKKTLNRRLQRLNRDISQSVNLKNDQQDALLAKKFSLLRPLTPEQQSRIQKELYKKGSPHDIIASLPDTGDVVTRDSFQKLRPGVWLNDEVIHHYFSTLAKRDEAISSSRGCRRCHFFKSFFITKLLDETPQGYCYRNVKRWSKKVPGKDIFNLDKIFIPVNVGNMHWCALVIFVQQKRLQYYDSMGGSGQRYLKGVFQYLKDEMKDKKKTDGTWDDWELLTCQPDTPQQENGFDCGVFSCMYAHFLSRGDDLTFSQNDVTDFRKRIAISILNGKALD